MERVIKMIFNKKLCDYVVGFDYFKITIETWLLDG